ncbi:hypothetical protein E4P32_05790 [Herbaspirillum sp. 3R11]|nr:hypothetical protein DZB54_02375 [Herbaspirillum sp. 3R-3a1]TFI11016.1 hypothetical protein E4P32_05790 [Herbaspirillum sp. 3R11]TFI16923.1 hypothetical protein E4P31_05790 [Herbaspirillum sp. 3R-11]TFI23404.1 hypothetical protein E4P30_17405 [Herbaspirillum sp. 3C11]
MSDQPLRTISVMSLLNDPRRANIRHAKNTHGYAVTVFVSTILWNYDVPFVCPSSILNKEKQCSRPSRNSPPAFHLR